MLMNITLILRYLFLKSKRKKTKISLFKLFDKNSKESSKIFRRFTNKGIYPYKMAFSLLIPLRNVFLSPNELIKRLYLREDFFVLEIETGPGYFSPSIAKALPKGKLFLADIQQEMLKKAKHRLEKRKVENVSFYLCDGKNFDFEYDYFDRVFMVTFVGEVENKSDYFKEIHRILKADGLLSITELAGEPDMIKIDELEKLAGEFDFHLKQKFGSKKKLYSKFCETRSINFIEYLEFYMKFFPL